MDNDKSILELILDELREMRQEIKILNSISAKQEENIKLHIKRSDNLELLVTLHKEQLSNEIEPLKTFKANIEGGLKLIGGLAVLTGLIVGLFELAKMVL